MTDHGYQQPTPAPMPTVLPPCAICGGKKEEHGPDKSRHVYTETPGNLMTHDQAQRQQAQPQQPQIIRLPGAQTNEAGAIGRLCEVLMENGLLTMQEALYVAGYSGKPKQDGPYRSGAASGYRDPAQGVLPL